LSLAVVFEYEVDPARADAFEAAYDGAGEWARYFAGADGYLGTELLRGAEGRYLVIDRWRSEADYDGFLAANAREYAARSVAAEALWRRERALGRFEGG
jgi:heme-degrading monooxygenase HmoA